MSEMTKDPSQLPHPAPGSFVPRVSGKTLSVVDAPTAAALMRGDDALTFVLLDVREQHQWAAGHAPAAVHQPLRTLDPTVAPPTADDDPASTQVLLVVSRSGNRAVTAVALLARAGFEAVLVRGGMLAWVAAGHPVVKDDGTPGLVI